MAKQSCVTNRGHTMFLDHLDSLFLAKHGCHDPLVTCVLDQFISEGDTVVDVGAHIGYHTIIASELVGKTGRVFAFEPNPISFALLEKNIDVNHCDNVTAVQKAVSDVVGTIELYISPTNTGDNMTCDNGCEWHHTTVEVTTIDEYFAGYNGLIDFVKLDVQGDEGNVLDGMVKTTNRNDDIKIIAEFCAGTLPGDPSDSLRVWEAHDNALYFVYMEKPPNDATPGKDLFPVHLAQMGVDELIAICNHFSSCIEVVLVTKQLEDK